MKTCCLFTVLASLLLAACHKTDTGSNRDLLTGKWELRQTTGGIAGTVNYEPGIITIRFDNNGQFEYIYGINVNGIPRQGPYALKKYANSGDWQLSLQYMQNGQSIAENDSVRLDGNKLLFLPATTCCDIPTVIYERLR